MTSAEGTTSTLSSCEERSLTPSSSSRISLSKFVPWRVVEGAVISGPWSERRSLTWVLGTVDGQARICLVVFHYHHAGQQLQNGVSATSTTVYLI